MDKQYIYTCNECKATVSEDDTICSACGADVSEVNDISANVKTTENAAYPRPAGFWIRVAAASVDALVFTPLILLSYFNLFVIKSYLFSLVLQIPYLVYQPYMESRYGATLGKMALKIQVINDCGQFLSISKAYLRYVPYLLFVVVSVISDYFKFRWPGFEQVITFRSLGNLHFKSPVESVLTFMSIFWMIDVLTIVFNGRKRALHDYMAGSYCVRRDSKSSSSIRA